MDVFDKMASDFRKEARIPRKSLKIQRGDTETFKKHQKNMMKKNPQGYLRWLAFQGARYNKGQLSVEKIMKNLQNKLTPGDRKKVLKWMKTRKRDTLSPGFKKQPWNKPKKKASEEEFYYNLMLRMASEDEEIIDDLDDGFDRFASDYDEEIIDDLDDGFDRFASDYDYDDDYEDGFDRFASDYDYDDDYEDGFDRFASDMVGHGIFDEYDEDGDGMISRDEWGGSDAVFDALDLDDDGMLSRDEISTGIGESFAEFNRYASYDDDYDDLIDDLDGFDRYASDYDDDYDLDDGFDRYASDDDYDDYDFEYRMAKGRGKSKQDRKQRVKRYKKTRRLLEKKYKNKPWWIVWKAYQGAYTPSGLNRKRLQKNLKDLGLSMAEFKKLTRKVGRKGKKMKQQDKKEMMKQLKKPKR